METTDAPLRGFVQCTIDYYLFQARASSTPSESGALQDKPVREKVFGSGSANFGEFVLSMLGALLSACMEFLIQTQDSPIFLMETTKWEESATWHEGERCSQWLSVGVRRGRLGAAMSSSRTSMFKRSTTSPAKGGVFYPVFEFASPPPRSSTPREHQVQL